MSSDLPPEVGIVPAASPTPRDSSVPIVARSGQYYRNTRYIMTAVTIVMGFWFLYDGFVRYPAENAKIQELKAKQSQAHFSQQETAQISTELKNHVFHSDTDLFIQRLLAFALPPAGLLLLLWALYNSRGEYRLSGDTLYVPGHPPVPLSAIRELDETLWDRKGIAYLQYAIDGGAAGRIKIDDFVYDRTPTDKIVQAIRDSMLPTAEIVITNEAGLVDAASIDSGGSLAAESGKPLYEKPSS